MRNLVLRFSLAALAGILASVAGLGFAHAQAAKGASGLPLWSFQLANVSSGLLWPLLLLAPGAFSLSLW